MYQGIPFRMLSIPEVEDYLTETKQSYGRYCERIQRVYLVGADPFALSARNLLERIDLIRKYLPNVMTITMYARTDNIASKSDEDLKALISAVHTKSNKRLTTFGAFTMAGRTALSSM